MKMNIFAHEPRKSSICWILSMLGTVNESLGEIIVWFSQQPWEGVMSFQRGHLCTCAHTTIKWLSQDWVQCPAAEQILQEFTGELRSWHSFSIALLRHQINSLFSLVVLMQEHKRCLPGLLVILCSGAYDYPKKMPSSLSCSHPLCLGHSFLLSSTEYLQSARHVCRSVKHSDVSLPSGNVLSC